MDANNERQSGPRGQPAERVDVKALVNQTLIDAMEKEQTPWQKNWSVNSMAPKNALTGHGYRGVNRLLLSLSGGGREDPRWVTYNQAASQGWQVKGGERGTMIVKLLDLARKPEEGVGSSDRDSPQDEAAVKRMGLPVLMRYYVFNAEQIDGMPKRELPTDRENEAIAKAEAVMTALQEKTGLVVIHGRKQPCYVPATDQILLPRKASFSDSYAYFSCALHEAGHSTLSEKRMARREALSERWGDEAYGMEELRAELCSLWVGAETGIAHGLSDKDRQKHLDNHKAYLQSWIKAIKKDPHAIFSAARDAEKMSEYLLDLAREQTALEPHKEWLAEHERAPDMALAR